MDVHDLTESTKPLWLNPMTGDSAFVKQWDKGLDERRAVLLEKVGSVGLPFVQLSGNYDRIEKACELVRDHGGVVCARLDPWKPWSKTEPEFPTIWSARHTARMDAIATLATEWAAASSQYYAPIIILLNHEEWPGAGFNTQFAMLKPVMDVLVTSIPGVQLSWYNAGQVRFEGDNISPFVPADIHQGDKACSLYYTDVLRARETMRNTSENKTHLTTWHCFDEAWVYDNTDDPWGRRNWMMLNHSGASFSYHESVGASVRACLARVVYSPSLLDAYLRNMDFFIQGLNTA